MHPNNIHHKPYDFKTLVLAHQELEQFVFTNTFGAETVDFSKPEAV